ncbi:MAG: ABC transporter permease [Elusimicrobiota bacterium]
MSEARRYFRIWVRMAAMSLGAQTSHPLGSIGFLLGKLIRIFFFFAFVIAIFRNVRSLGGYDLAQMALFFLTFNLVDLSAQILFRGIYGARRVVEEGEFDFYLTQPCSPLFRLMFSTLDFLDLATILPVLALLAEVFRRFPGFGFSRYLIYSLLTANGIAIAMAIHVMVAGLAVRTQELENSVWVYRDLMFMGKFPTDIYGRTARLALTFLVPVAVMCTFPAKAFLGTLSPAWAAYSLALCAGLLALSRWYWLNSVERYTSSSS